MHGLLDACRTVDEEGWTDNGGGDATLHQMYHRYLLVGAPKATLAGVGAIADDIRAAMLRSAGPHPALIDVPTAASSADDDMLRLCYQASDLLGDAIPGRPDPEDRLRRALAARVRSDDWDVNGGESVRCVAVGGVLVIRASRTVHVDIDAAIEGMRREKIRP